MTRGRQGDHRAGLRRCLPVNPSAPPRLAGRLPVTTVTGQGGGEPPGRWWGKGAEALGLEPGSLVERQAYDRVVDQRLDPRDGVTKLGRSPTSSPRPSRLTTPALSAWPYWPPGIPGPAKTHVCVSAGARRRGRGRVPVTRRRPREGVGEPLFGEDWWTSDQQLFQDSLTRRGAPAAPPGGRAAATLRKRDAAAAAATSRTMLPLVRRSPRSSR